MKHALLVILLNGSLACAMASRDAAKGDSAPCVATTRSLAVIPTELTRGDAVELTMAWDVEPMPTTVQAQWLLSAASSAIELTLPMAIDENGVARGTQLNPFGLGAPDGEVAVIVSGAVGGECPLSATTTFVLH